MKRTNWILRAAIVTALAASTTGCALLGESAEDVGKAAGDVVHFYCDNVSIPEVRDEIRGYVNRYATPHSVAINCADPTTPQ